MKYVIGYASLLSPISIRRLFPHVGRIIPVTIPNHARCFNSFGTLSIRSGLAQSNDPYLAHASAVLMPGTDMLALAFELDDEDFITYQRHEFRYDLKHVQVSGLDTHEQFNAVMCYENVDQNMDVSRVGADTIWDLYETYNTRSFWHGTHLPAVQYLEHCIASALHLGPAFLDNFLDTSFIYDRATSIRHYLWDQGIDIEAYKTQAQLSKIF